MCDLSGCFFCNAAVATGKPVGPIFALATAQVLIVTLVTAIIKSMVPHWMQFIGMGFGMVGTLVLSLTEYY